MVPVAGDIRNGGFSMTGGRQATFPAKERQYACCERRDFSSSGASRQDFQSNSTATLLGMGTPPELRKP